MKRVVIDTNVAIVANGNPDPNNRTQHSLKCRLAAVERLKRAPESECVFLDLEGEIEREYRRHLNPSGQLGVGDQFYLRVLHSAPRRVERVALSRRSDGEYEALPQILIDAGFDPSDRKFAALAKKTGARVLNAVDSDWIEHAETLRHASILVENVCGCESSAWFEPASRD